MESGAIIQNGTKIFLKYSYSEVVVVHYNFGLAFHPKNYGDFLQFSLFINIEFCTCSQVYIPGDGNYINSIWDRSVRTYAKSSGKLKFLTL